MQQNRVPVIRSLQIANISEKRLEKITVEIFAKPEFSAPAKYTFENLDPQELVDFTSPDDRQTFSEVVDLHLDPNFFMGITERFAGLLEIVVSVNSVEVERLTQEISLLAYNEWGGDYVLPELLAAYITPNHPLVAQVLRRASEKLKSWTGDGALCGYQRKSENHVLKQMAAIFAALEELDIHYSMPPQGFEISGQKIDSYSDWKKKFIFHGDNIHTSKLGAEMNARSAAEGIAYSADPRLKPLQDMMNDVTPPMVDVKREDGKPVVFITGDSTVKNADKEEDGMWGWGSQAYTIFDERKITIANCAMAGRSCRTFMNEGRWEKVYNSVHPGDFVLIQFGHNDFGELEKPKYRGEIFSAQDTCHVYQLKEKGTYELVYSFGWYLKKFIDDVREKGGTPILVSLTPRNEWENGKIERRNDTYGRFYREVVEATGVEFVDMHNITADYLDRKCGSKEKANPYYKRDHTHTSLKGARLNAKSMKKGLKKNHSPLAKYLK